MIPTELHLSLDFRSGGGSSCLSHWLKACDAPFLLREGDEVNDNAAPERVETLTVGSTHFKVNSGRLMAVLVPLVPASMDEYHDRKRELAAAGWYELENPFVYANPLPPVSGWAVEWRLRLHSTHPAPDGSTCWRKKTVESEAPSAYHYSTGLLMAGLIGTDTNAPVVEVVTTWRESGKRAAVAEVRLPVKTNQGQADGESDLQEPLYGEHEVNAAVLLANGWEPLDDAVRRLTVSEEPYRY